MGWGSEANLIIFLSGVGQAGGQNKFEQKSRGVKANYPFVLGVWGGLGSRG